MSEQDFAPRSQPGRASLRRRYVNFERQEKNGVLVIAGAFDLNRPQIAGDLANSSNNPGRVPESRSWQGRPAVPESRLVSTMTETTYKQSVAGRIRQARTAKGISQETLAGVIGKRRTHVNEWENARATPRWPNLLLIGEALDVTPEWLLTGRDDSDGPA